MAVGYCVKCKEKGVELSAPEIHQTKKGGFMAKGKHQKCGTTVCAMMSKDTAEKALEDGAKKLTKLLYDRNMSESKPKKIEIIDGYAIKYHANGVTRWSKGKVVDGHTDGYWEWYRLDGSLKRSGYFKMGEPVGEWITYDDKGKPYKTTQK